MWDEAVMFRKDAAGDLAADVDLPAATGLDMRGPDLVPMVIEVSVPELAAPGDTLDIALQHCDDGATWVTVASFPQIAAIGEYFLTTISNKRYRRLHFDISAGANFGHVLAGYMTAGRYTHH